MVTGTGSGEQCKQIKMDYQKYIEKADKSFLNWFLGILIIWSILSWRGYFVYDDLANSLIDKPNMVFWLTNLFLMVVFFCWTKYLKGLIYEQILVITIGISIIVKICFHLIPVYEKDLVLFSSIEHTLLLLINSILIVCKKMAKR